MTWRVDEHDGVWRVIDAGGHGLTMPDEQAAHLVAAFYNDLLTRGYALEWTRSLLTASWVPA